MLGGQPRSGTSLLTSILRTSDDLLQGFELHIRKPSFIVGNNGRYTRNILEQLGLPGDEFDRIVEDHRDLCAHMNLGAWTGPKEEVSAEPPSGRETQDFAAELRARGELVSALLRRAAVLGGRSRWGFKILGDVIHAEQYAAVWPEAVVILLVRDPRDHALSVMKLNEQRAARGQPNFYDSYDAVARGWLHTVRDGRLALEASGLRHILLRYEDLVSDPTTLVMRLGKALSIDLTKGLEYYRQDFIDTHARRFSHHENLRNPIDPSLAGRWRERMSDADSEVFLRTAGDEMAYWGYV